ncbi:MAG: NDP-sugar synthase [Gammaproteobacteria bacterium]
MKAFLLAAGLGTRLRPLTESVPKCLVPIRGRPLLDIWLGLCARYGVAEVLVNVHHLPECVASFLARYGGPVRVRTVYEPVLLGSAGTVWSQRSFVAGERDFLVLYADNLTEVDLRRMVEFHRAHEASFTMGLVPTEVPREKGIVVLDHAGLVVEFAEKPSQPRSNLSNAGVYVAGPDLFEVMAPQPPPYDFGFDVLPRLVGRMHGYPIEEYLRDIGTPESLRQAERDWPGAPGTGGAVAG